MQRVLVLGSGRVCPPLVELITRDGSLTVTVGKWEISTSDIKHL